MKKKACTALLTATLCLGLLAGCASPEKQIQTLGGISSEERSEKDWLKLANAYLKQQDESQLRKTLVEADLYYPESKQLQSLMDEYLLPAPVPQHESGSYDGALRLHFDGTENSCGTLYLTVDHDEPWDELEQDDSIPDDGIRIREYPDEHGFKIDLYTPGEHTVRAFVVDGGEQVSRSFVGSYTLTGADFSGFAFSKPGGEYKAPMDLNFEGTEGGSVYYTLDGSDPLFVGEGGAVLHVTDGVLAEGPLPLLSGKRSITARCITENGLVSPLISAEYQLSMTFDAASNAVGEDDRFEYVGDDWNGLLYYDRQKGGKLQSLYNKKVDELSVFTYSIARKNLLEGDYNPDVISGEFASQLEETVTATSLYVRPTVGDSMEIVYVDGAKQKSQTWYGGKLPRNVGGSWCLLDGDAYELKGVTPIGVEEVAEKASLLTDQIAIWTSYSKSVQVTACDPDGGNERVLWTELDGTVQLDAVTDTVLLYHVGGKHMLYDLSTGARRENTLLPEGTKLLGYTSSAAYIYQNGVLTRVTIDYTKL